MQTSDELKAWIVKQKENCFSLLRELEKASPSLLHAMGFGGKSNAEALLSAFQNYVKSIEREIVKFEKEHPQA